MLAARARDFALSVPRHGLPVEGFEPAVQKYARLRGWIGLSDDGRFFVRLASEVKIESDALKTLREAEAEEVEQQARLNLRTGLAVEACTWYLALPETGTRQTGQEGVGVVGYALKHGWVAYLDGVFSRKMVAADVQAQVAALVAAEEEGACRKVLFDSLPVAEARATAAESRAEMAERQVLEFTGENARLSARIVELEAQVSKLKSD